MNNLVPYTPTPLSSRSITGRFGPVNLTARGPNQLENALAVAIGGVVFVGGCMLLVEAARALRR